MFSVTWVDDARDELADEYVQPDLTTQQLIAQIVSRFNASLAADPAGIGESRGNWRRVAFDWPYAISYLCDPATHAVNVTRFWRYGRSTR